MTIREPLAGVEWRCVVFGCQTPVAGKIFSAAGKWLGKQCTFLWEITQLSAVQERVAAVHLRRKYEEEIFPKKVQCRIDC